MTDDKEFLPFILPLLGDMASKNDSDGYYSIGISIECIFVFFLSVLNHKSHVPDEIWHGQHRNVYCIV